MSALNPKKFCFIICSNDEVQLQECLLYLSLLQVPEGYEVETMVITDAPSMTSGYNEGMRASDAKYKIYLHQDSYILHSAFLADLLKIFRRDVQIGMVGIIGAKQLSRDGVMWHEKRVGNFYRLDEMVSGGYDGVELLRRGIKDVEAIDGFLMATQVDLPWREDVFTGWDFYDVSQCMEFRKAGYRIVVPGQKKPWVRHTCGLPNLYQYKEHCEALLREYPEIAQKNPDRLRILCFDSHQIRLHGLFYSLTELGHNVTVAEYNVTLDGLSDEDTEAVEEYLEEGNYDLVFTYDFSRGVAAACENMGVRYYAWIYDAPLMTLFSKEARLSHNYISTFDRMQLVRLADRKLPHLFYLPLAAEVSIFGTAHIGKRDEKKYTSDVSFVGRLYDKRGFEELFEGSTPKLRDEAERVAGSCNCIWDGETNLFGKASDELIDYIRSKQPKKLWEEWAIDPRYYAESMRLVRRCNEVERIRILNALAEKFHVVLYTEDTNNTVLHNVEIRPWVDYTQEMPKVFYLSKINLNITSRSIESGVPQRVWDILSVGGFCLTNYQAELEEYFVIGRDLDVYHSLEELEEKITYYLAHEEERIRIAINGYRLVREKHDSQKRLKQALEYIFSEEAEG